jgi:hypothetical protein
MWLANYTQAEIAAAVDTPIQTVNDWVEELSDFGQMSESGKSLANHAVEFEAPIYTSFRACLPLRIQIQ